MNLEDDELLQEFLAESREHLATIEADLLNIEEAGANIDEDLVNKVFRAAHSIKGGSGFFNLKTIMELAHGAETVLDMIRSREMVPNPEVVNILLQAFDKLRELIGDPGASNQADITDHVMALKGLASSYLPQERKPSLARQVDLAPAGRSVPLLVAEVDVEQAVRRGQFVYLAVYDLIHDVERRGKTPLDVIRALSEVGVILEAGLNLEALGGLDAPPSNSIPLEVVYATVVEPQMAEIVFDLPADKVTLLRDPRHQDAPAAAPASTLPTPAVKPVAAAAAHAPAPAPTVAAPAPVVPAAPTPPDATAEAAAPEPPEASAPPAKAGGRKGSGQPKAAKAAADSQPSAGADATVRINVSVLDTLMNLAGELVLSRNQLREAIALEDSRNVTASSQRINLVTADLQAAIMQARMQPVGNVFSKFPRVVRDLSREMKKDIELVIDGREVELDKTLIEGLSDPLTHMVRNSVDHGIETPAQRAAAGKPAKGTVTLKAFHEAGQVVLEVADDGKGIDPEKVAASAVNRGLITRDQAKVMGVSDKLALIFLPGLSTAEKVTDVSGRGVGMDVVKTNLDRLGGKVEISSEMGKGTLFRIKLPLTLAIIPSLIVSVGDERFAIPQLNVVELLRIPAAELKKRIEVVGDSEVLLLRGSLVPLVHFADVLNVPRTYRDTASGAAQASRRRRLADRRSPQYDAVPPGETQVVGADAAGHPERRAGAERRTSVASDLNVVVMASGTMRYGLVVDDLHKTEEIVVKPLGRHLKERHEYAGATIMGDGTVALIVDAAGLAAKAELNSLSGTQRAVEVAEDAQRERLQDSHSFLLFHNAPGETCSVPLDLVLRIERVDWKQVEKLGGRRTMQYRGASLPLVTLSDAANVGSIDESQEPAVIVVSVAGREVGLLGAMPVDVVETTGAIDQETLRQPGVIGSTIVKDRTVLLVDAFELVQSVYPNWAKPAPAFVDVAAPAAAAATGAGTPAAPAVAPMILLAEDSDFFRSQVKRYIESEGYRVVTGADGQFAWEALEANGAEVRVVVTDIEMPRMTGLELATRIKGDSRFAHLPIIGLTSLAGEDDIARGKAAGIDDYQIKLDRDRLLDGIRSILTNGSRAGVAAAVETVS
jgi:two-component system, chemotaxis family, sensor kinase CheA